MHPARDPFDPHAEAEEVQDTFKGAVGAAEWEAGY
jgi:hypothetical protein